MAKLKAVLSKDEFQALPEPRRGDYVERDGRYWLDVEAVGDVNLEDVGGLRRAHEEQKGKRREAEARLEAFKDLDPAKAREAIAALAAGDAGKGKGAVEAARAEFEAKLKSEIEPRDARIAKLIEQSRRAATVAAIAKAGGSADLLYGAISNRIKAIDENGELVFAVLNEQGHEAETRVAGKTGRMGVEEFVGSLKTDARYAPAFAGSGPSGSGGAGPNRGAGNPQPNRTPEQKIANAFSSKP